MNLFDRIVLTLFMLFMLVVSFIVIMFSMRVFSIDVFWTSIAPWYGRWEIGVLGAILFIISIRFLISGLKPKHSNESVIRTSEMGNISISINAVESLVLKLIRDIDKIKDIKVTIKKVQDGVAIFLKIVVTHDVVIPELSLELQKDVKEYIEKSTGLNVRDVSVKVANIYNPSFNQRSVK